MGRLTLDGFREAVAVQGWKMTPQRIAIVEYVSNSLHHPTAEDICIHVNERFPMTSRATVYNTLHLLRDYGLLQEINEAGVIRFDPNIRDHHHFGHEFQSLFNQQILIGVGSQDGSGEK